MRIVSIKIPNKTGVTYNVNIPENSIPLELHDSATQWSVTTNNIKRRIYISDLDFTDFSYAAWAVEIDEQLESQVFSDKEEDSTTSRVGIINRNRHKPSNREPLDFIT